MMSMFGLFQKGASPIVTRLGMAHADECAALHAASFSYPWPLADIEALLLASSTYADGAFGKPNDLQGFILSRLAADEAEILTIAVKPRKRGQGIAGKLMRANMAQLQAAGAKSWFLEVEAQNASALALYKRFGFEQVGERKSYYRKPDGDNALAYILKRSLR
jgi:ribosomal-protein-alanine N-acetyltransferase